MFLKIFTIIGGLLGVLVASFSGVQLSQFKNEASLGSVQQANEYHSTSTSYLSTPNSVIKTGSGAIGSVVISGSNTGRIDMYDTTTTNKNLRTGQAPTATIYIGSIVASQAAGTYTYDIEFYNGLYLDFTGSLPTSTITYR